MNNKIPSNFDLPKLVEILYYPKLHFVTLVTILKLAKKGLKLGTLILLTLKLRLLK